MSILLVGNALRRDMVIHPENDERNDQREEVQKKPWQVIILPHFFFENIKIYGSYKNYQPHAKKHQDSYQQIHRRRRLRQPPFS